MNSQFSRSEALRRIADAQEEKARRGESLRRLAIVIGLVLVVMLAAAGYILASDSIGGPEATFPPLPEPPQVGKVLQPEGPKQPMSQGPRVGEPAPDFSFVAPDGTTKKLSDFKGQPVLINFWATWCPYCIKEMPDIEAIYRAEQDKGFVVLGISFDEDADAARKFLQLRGVTFPSVLETNFIAAGLYRVQPIPASYFIDRNGKISDIQIGAMTRSMIKVKVDKIL